MEKALKGTLVSLLPLYSKAGRLCIRYPRSGHEVSVHAGDLRALPGLPRRVKQDTPSVRGERLRRGASSRRLSAAAPARASAIQCPAPRPRPQPCGTSAAGERVRPAHGWGCAGAAARLGWAGLRRSAPRCAPRRAGGGGGAPGRAQRRSAPPPRPDWPPGQKFLWRRRRGAVTGSAVPCRDAPASAAAHPARAAGDGEGGIRGGKERRGQRFHGDVSGRSPPPPPASPRADGASGSADTSLAEDLIIAYWSKKRAQGRGGGLTASAPPPAIPVGSLFPRAAGGAQEERRYHALCAALAGGAAAGPVGSLRDTWPPPGRAFPRKRRAKPLRRLPRGSAPARRSGGAAIPRAPPSSAPRISCPIAGPSA
ncbi:translation initiation factor IF-2-like isoform X2 [Pipra filicauda]|uniref:Translation initiation factor IF-2-like isoform X2 n=1 Tax=Pipra filicauda TaxID=649802 RepID=A0A7R5KJ70_9PASS|nr:translation initiation factor IF-2-like isoform X2 [Pipra filicauda]